MEMKLAARPQTLAPTPAHGLVHDITATEPWRPTMEGGSFPAGDLCPPYHAHHSKLQRWQDVRTGLGCGV